MNRTGLSFVLALLLSAAVVAARDQAPPGKSDDPAKQKMDKLREDVRRLNEELRAREAAARLANGGEVERVARDAPEALKPKIDEWLAARKAAAEAWMAVADGIKPDVKWADVEALKQKAVAADAQAAALDKPLEYALAESRLAANADKLGSADLKAKVDALKQLNQKELEAAKAASAAAATLAQARTERRALDEELMKLTSDAQAKAAAAAREKAEKERAEKEKAQKEKAEKEKAEKAEKAKKPAKQDPNKEEKKPGA